MVTALIVTSLFVIAIYLFMKSPKFGTAPTGERLKKIQHSPNYRNGEFQNVSETPQLAEGATYFTDNKKFFFSKKIRNKPSRPLPSVKTDLKSLRPDENVLVWFGHSSYFMQVDGKTILVDPVLSGAASPVAFTTRSYPGTDIYTPDDFPEIDILILTHDHWDHLDYDTVTRLKPKVKLIITGLGTGAHLERWGFDIAKIIEKDWDETIPLDSGFTIYTTTARHFSGRTFTRNKALWMAFLLETPKRKIYIGGDSGYDTHFAAIGKQFGPIDLAILEVGQYNEDWKYIHMLAEEVVPAARDLNAKMLLPVHWAKFSLAMHPWDEPIIVTVEDAKKAQLPVLTPMIGEKVDLDKPRLFDEWWKNID
jgi:L-ascorbate metabolism protein UlaG (beta-lactamase superfamily)